MKKIFIILGICIALAAGVAFFVTRNEQPQTTVAPPTITPSGAVLPQPMLPDKSPLLPDPAYTVGAVSGSFPQSVPVYKAGDPPVAQTEVARLAAIFKLSTSPTITPLKDGTFYVWSTNPGMIVGPGVSRVDYGFKTEATAPLTSPDSEFIAAGQIIVNTVQSGVTSALSSVLYFAPLISDLNYVPRDKARAIQLTFSSSLGGLPLITGSPAASHTVLRFGATKALLYYSGRVYPPFEPAGSSPLVSIETAKQRLVDGQGVLLSAFSPVDINEHDTKLYTFSLASVHRAELAYFFNEESRSVTPVFLFYGSAIDQGSGKDVDTVTIVSAVP